MSIVRTSKGRARYTVLDNTVLEDKRLSWKAKGLHCYLMSKPDGWKVKVINLIEQAQDGRDAVYSAIAELVEAGYAERVQPRREDGTVGEYEYTIHEVPPLTGLPYTANPVAVNSKPGTTYPAVSTETAVNTEGGNSNPKPLTSDQLFAQAWAAYPKRPGNSRKAAQRAWDARVKQGVDPQVMYDGTLNYALYCHEQNIVGSNSVKMAQTFYGPDEHFNADWDLPESSPPAAASTNGRRQPKEESEADYLGVVAYVAPQPAGSRRVLASEVDRG